MEERMLYIGRWKVCFIFAEEGYDQAEVMERLYESGASDYALRQAANLMAICEWNCGFTYADPETLEAVVFIGPTKSGEEFVNTTSHEIYHLSVAIAQSLGIDLDSESPAYLAGDSMQSIIDIICERGCSKCHQTNAQR